MIALRQSIPRTVSSVDPSWTHQLHKRHQHCSGWYSREEAVEILKEANPHDPYWRDDAQAIRKQDEMRAIKMRQKVLAEKKKQAKARRVHKMLSISEDDKDKTVPFVDPRDVYTGRETTVHAKDSLSNEQIEVKCRAHGMYMHVALIT